jgi:predicted Fe-S protein YdhL (DUF1289 family)
MNPDTNSSTLASPCVRNCCLDDKDVCLGCFRNIDEITGWSSASDHQRDKILKQAAARRAIHQQKYPHLK